MNEKDKMFILNTILQEVKPLKLREKIYWRIVEFLEKKNKETAREILQEVTKIYLYEKPIESGGEIKCFLILPQEVKNFAEKYGVNLGEE